MSTAASSGFSPVVTCEHATNRVPPGYRVLFASREAEAALGTHRGFDPGAAGLAKSLARTLGAPAFLGGATRLLCDLNRSRNHPRLFSEFTGSLPEDARARILARYWAPYRESVERAVASAAARGRPVLHISCHSFTPVWEGRMRGVDLGILYDPARPGERAWADSAIALLRSEFREWRIRRNQPYRGTGDGLTTSLRRIHRNDRYLGIEIEVSQAFPKGDRAVWRRTRARLVRVLARLAREP